MTLGTGGDSAKVIAIVAIVAVLVLALPLSGIFAAIFIPNFLTAMERAKQKRTMADMRTVAQEIETRAATSGSYPQKLEGVHTDGWNHPMRYECIDGERPCAGYAITSPGKDGAFEHESARDYAEGGASNFRCDIVFANGAFVQYPEGVQR